MAASTPLYVVLGASGVVGMFCCRDLLQRGGNVRAVMRDPEKMQAELHDLITYFPRGKRGRLQVVKGDVTKPEDMRAAMEGAKTVIFAATGNNYAGTGSSYDVDYLGVGVCAEAAKAAGVQKLVLCSCAFVTEQHTFTMTRFFMNVIKWRFADHKLAGERLLRKSGLPYSIVRLGALYLSNDGTGGQYKLRVGQGDQIKGIISRADAAAVAVACAIDPALALNATFEIAQNEFFEEYNQRDEPGSRWEVLMYLKPDADTGSVTLPDEPEPPRPEGGDRPAQPAAPGPSSEKQKGQGHPQQQGWFGLPNPLAQLQIGPLPFTGDQGKSRACRWLSTGKPGWEPNVGESRAAPTTAEESSSESSAGTDRAAGGKAANGGGEGQPKSAEEAAPATAAGGAGEQQEEGLPTTGVLS